MTYGVELALRSGHADRGFIINDRPVVQPVMWLSGSGAEFSAWSSFPLAETTDRARPRAGIGKVHDRASRPNVLLSRRPQLRSHALARGLVVSVLRRGAGPLL